MSARPISQTDRAKLIAKELALLVAAPSVATIGADMLFKSQKASVKIPAITSVAAAAAFGGVLSAAFVDAAQWEQWQHERLATVGPVPSSKMTYKDVAFVALQSAVLVAVALTLMERSQKKLGRVARALILSAAVSAPNVIAVKPFHNLK